MNIHEAVVTGNRSICLL